MSEPQKLFLRVALLVCLLLLATWAAHLVREALNLEIRPSNEQQVHRVIMLGAAAYVGLLALPFVPGAEIGLAMLASFGARIAPLIYAWTIGSMMLAFTIGRFLPIAMLERLLSFLRMRRAAALVARAAPLSPEERIALLLEGQSKRALSFCLKYRFVAIALAVNTPGNSIIGGGGGIMMLAGMSGIFAPVPTLVTVAVAVSPVPLAVMLLGLEV